MQAANVLKRSLAFRQDQTFKIVQFTDVHWQTGEEADQRSRALMDRILDEEKPDLVVFTGDLIQCGRCKDQVEAFLQAIEPTEERGIPWTFVFGNHDAEWGVTHEELMQLQLSRPLCLSQEGPETVSGTGNYALKIYNHERTDVQALMYFFDSHQYAPEGYGKYAWIKRDQIQWYAERSAAFTASHGRPLPALAFFHIPLPEYLDVREQGVTYGQMKEDVHSPVINSGLFQAFVESGDVMGTFAGHDHVNDFWGQWYGVKLCYGRVTGYNTYPRQGGARGARVIRLTANEHDFETWIRQDDGAKLTGELHDPKRVQ